MYSPEKRGISLNYIAKNLKKSGNGHFMQKAWGKYRGSNAVKKELTWMFDKGLAKKFREANDEE